MSKVVKVKDVVIGRGLPKICVPMVGKTLTDLLEESSHIKDMDIDIVEWRADFYEDIGDTNNVVETLRSIRQILPGKPIMFTFRNAEEGGQKEISVEAYIELNKVVSRSKLIDIIDLELFKNEKVIADLSREAYLNNVAVIISTHDFKSTPSKDEIIFRLKKAFSLGADIAKIAVIPNSASDVLALLDATRIMNEEYDLGPVVTVSMSQMGIISRLSGELFGSSITFASAKNSSASGQIPAAELRKFLELLRIKKNRNIALIGMPGSGKTTIGRLASERLGLKFVDADEYIVASESRTIPEIFTEGEAAFRAIEKKAIHEISIDKNVVIATGGGVIKDYSNIETLKENGIVIFLDRPIENIISDINTSTRPLLKGGVESLYRLLKERYELYKDYCDYHIVNDCTVENAVEKIAEIYKYK
jgi:3-dehydroquinate dehydratase-1